MKKNSPTYNLSSDKDSLANRFKRKKFTANDYIEKILAGDRIMLSRAITLIESHRPAHQKLAEAVIEGCMGKHSTSMRIGITGTPGVGKSTFIEAFGQHILTKKHKVAVLAIDPSSQLNKGSILGDKTRMQTLSVHPDVFIRPSATGDSLGGVARKTRESILLCEAAGYDVIIVETVGVGQSEIAVHSMVDFFLLLLLPNAGDELQGIKRGIMEMADLIAINKADGDFLTQAKIARRQCKNALHLFPPKNSGWIATALTCSALKQEGMAAIWDKINAFYQQINESGYLQELRGEQALYWMKGSIEDKLKAIFYQFPAIKDTLQLLESKVQQNQLSPFNASQQLLDIFTQALEKD